MASWACALVVSLMINPIVQRAGRISGFERQKSSAGALRRNRALAFLRRLENRQDMPLDRRLADRRNDLGACQISDIERIDRLFSESDDKCRAELCVRPRMKRRRV